MASAGTPTHLADATHVTEEQARALRLMTLDQDGVDVRIVAGRAAIVHVGSGEAVQFLTVTSAGHVKWLVEQWASHFESLKAKAAGR